MANTYFYDLNGKLYFNITNYCDNDCVFCLRNNSDGVGDNSLWLSEEPGSEELIDRLKSFDLSPYTEAVFCGFGEPTQNLDALVAMAKYIKDKNPNFKLRLNTNGLGSLSNGCDIAPVLKGLIDTVSISLNATNAKDYHKICRSIYGEKAYDGLLSFAESCIKHGIDVVMTVVDIMTDDEIAQCTRIAESIGATLRVRPYIE